MNKLKVNYSYIFYTHKNLTDSILDILDPLFKQHSLFCHCPVDLILKSQVHKSSLNTLVYHLDKNTDHDYVLKAIKKISLHINIILISPNASSSSFKHLISYGIFKILEAPFYKSELNLLIEKSEEHSKLDHKFEQMLHVCDDVNDYIHFKTLHNKHQSKHKLSMFEFDKISEQRLSSPPLSFSKLISQNLKNNQDSKTHNILIVEDNFDLNKKMSIWFRNHNYNVTSALSYKEAISKLSESPVDFIFIDIALDGHSGEDLINYVCQDFPNIIPIVITAFNDTELMLKCINSGAYDFITKPFNPNQILQKLDYYIQKKSLKNASISHIKQIALKAS